MGAMSQSAVAVVARRGRRPAPDSKVVSLEKRVGHLLVDHIGRAAAEHELRNGLRAVALALGRLHERLEIAAKSHPRRPRVAGGRACVAQLSAVPITAMPMMSEGAFLARSVARSGTDRAIESGFAPLTIGWWRLPFREPRERDVLVVSTALISVPASSDTARCRSFISPSSAVASTIAVTGCKIPTRPPPSRLSSGSTEGIAGPTMRPAESTLSRASSIATTRIETAA